MKQIALILSALALSAGVSSCGQGANTATVNDTNTPLHLLAPDYNVPYGVPAKDAVKADLDRVLKFLDANTPIGIKEDGTLEKGAFRLASYE